MLKYALWGSAISLVFVFTWWHDLDSAQRWQPSNQLMCLPQPSSMRGVTAGPEVIANKRGDGHPHIVASALKLARFPRNLSEIKVYCNVSRKPCEDEKCFGLHISGIGIEEQPDGTARIFVAAWNDNSNTGKDYYLQMFAEIPDGGVLGPMS